MSGLAINNGLSFTNQGQRIAFSSGYNDRNGNDWRVVVLGTPEIVEPFVNQPRLDFEVQPLTPEEFSNEMNRHADQNDEFEFEESTMTDLPELSIDLTPMNVQGPHLIRFEIDPDLNPGESFITTFHLKCGDAMINVTCRADAGQVDMFVGPRGRTLKRATAQGSINTFGPIPTEGHSEWRVQVTCTDGPAIFTLSGDIIVS